MTTTFPTIPGPLGLTGKPIADRPACFNQHTLPAGYDDPQSLYYVPEQHRDGYPSAHYAAALAWASNSLREPRWKLARDLEGAGLLRPGQIYVSPHVIPYELHLDTLAKLARNASVAAAANARPARCPVCGHEQSARTGAVIIRALDGRAVSLPGPDTFHSCELCWKTWAWVYEQAHLYEAGPDGRSRLESVCTAAGIRVNLADVAPAADELAPRRARRTRRDKENT